MRKMENTRFVNKGIVKKDAKALLSGRPVYTDDIAPSGCLVVKLLRSPHAHAWIEDISTAAALKVPGIEAVFTYKDVPEKRYTQAGQTFPEPSADDRLILDQHIRYNGDPVAIIAGRDENCVSQAMKRIKVKYKVLEPLLDFTKAIDNPIIIHPEDNYVVKSDIGNDVKRNICASQCRGNGDIDKVLSECDHIIDQTYHIKAVSQAMMEVFCAFTSIDIYGRIKVISSTQIPFHARRIIARGLKLVKGHIADRKITVLQALCRDVIKAVLPANIQLLRAAHSTHQYIPHGPVHCFQLRFQFLHLARPLLCFILLYRLFCREARCR